VLYPAGIPPESFYPYLVGEGTQSKQWRDLDVEDALANHDVTDAQAGGGRIDYETLLEIDPDAIAVRIQGEITDEYFRENVLDHLKDHEVASELAAVRNDRVFYGGLTYQGPIIHLFQLERAARGLYPTSSATNGCSTASGSRTSSAGTSTRNRNRCDGPGSPVSSAPIGTPDRRAPRGGRRRAGRRARAGRRSRRRPTRAGRRAPPPAAWRSRSAATGA